MQPYEQILEEGWEDSVFLGNNTKKFLEKLFKNKQLQSAIQEYVRRRAAGEAPGIAIHKAGSMHGLGSDKLFGEIIKDMVETGLISEEITAKTNLSFEEFIQKVSKNA